MVKLTHNDKLVLYGLARWPNLHDDELGGKIGVKRSTLTVIRNKLAKEGLYSKHYLPDLGRLGCELLVARYGDFNPLTPWSKREKYASKEYELFYRISTDFGRVSLVAAENFTEMKRYLETAASRHASHGFLTAEGVTHAYFPAALSRQFMFFDFAPLLNRHFELGFKEHVVLDTKFRKPLQPDLSETQRRILYVMVQYPDLDDGEIAKKVSVTRQTVNSVKHDLLEQNLLKTVIFPDLGAIGLELIIFFHTQVKPAVPFEARAEAYRRMVEDGSHYMIAAGNMEAITLSAFRNYTDFETTHERIFSFVTKLNYLAKDPTIKIYPTHEIRNHMMLRCGPLVKRILHISEEL